MAYRVMQSQVARGNYIFDYCDRNAEYAKLLYNAALFRIRQIFTGYDKEKRSDNETQVFSEVALLEDQFPSIHVKKVISYCHLEKLMRVTDNPDFLAGLPMQSAQNVLKQAVQDFKDWLKALSDYKKHPEKYLGRPRMPRYKRSGVTTFTLSNQDAVLYFTDHGTLLKLPLVPERLYLPNLSNKAVLKEVKVIPFYDRYIISLTLEEPEVPLRPDLPYLCSVDFGIDNFAAIVCNDGSSKLYKGGAVLSDCQWFHKSRAAAISIITKGHDRYTASSRKLNSISVNNHNFINDQCHKISRDIIRFCMEHRAGTIILGENKFWKQNTSMGAQNNQVFVSMPFSLLKNMITYKAEREGIAVITQEESYTSRADITAMDYIPVYGVDDEKADFSGRRIKRGLYRCSNGLVINADCNGAANIMRKAVPDAWNGTESFEFLALPEVSGFHELNPKSNSVRGIDAV